MNASQPARREAGHGAPGDPGDPAGQDDSQAPAAPAIASDHPEAGGDTAYARPAPDPLELSRWLQSQLETRFRRPPAAEAASAPHAAHAAHAHATYFVIRSQSTGVLSVLAAASLGHDHDIVFGPQPFVDCLGFVHAAIVTSLVPDATSGTASGTTSGPTHADPEEHP